MGGGRNEHKTEKYKDVSRGLLYKSNPGFLKEFHGNFSWNFLLRNKRNKIKMNFELRNINKVNKLRKYEKEKIVMC